MSRPRRQRSRRFSDFISPSGLVCCEHGLGNLADSAQSETVVAAGRDSGVKKAWLTLADGTVFEGRPLGFEGEAVGEVVFNTAMTGYQEVLTDPSYKGQIITMTSPHIGN